MELTAPTLIAINTLLLGIVGFFFNRLILALDGVTKRQQDIELKHVVIQNQIMNITERLMELVRMVGIPEKVMNLESEFKSIKSDVNSLRERQHDIANKINGIYGMCQVEELKKLNFSLKPWKD